MNPHPEQAWAQVGEALHDLLCTEPEWVEFMEAFNNREPVLNARERLLINTLAVALDHEGEDRHIGDEAMLGFIAELRFLRDDIGPAQPGRVPPEQLAIGLRRPLLATPADGLGDRGATLAEEAYTELLGGAFGKPVEQRDDRRTLMDAVDAVRAVGARFGGPTLDRERINFELGFAAGAVMTSPDDANREHIAQMVCLSEGVSPDAFEDDSPARVGEALGVMGQAAHTRRRLAEMKTRDAATATAGDGPRA